jgi:hypothetical protein
MGRFVRQADIEQVDRALITAVVEVARAGHAHRGRARRPSPDGACARSASTATRACSAARPLADLLAGPRPIRQACGCACGRGLVLHGGRRDRGFFVDDDRDRQAHRTLVGAVRGFSSAFAAGFSSAGVSPPPALDRAASTLACSADNRSVMLSLSSAGAVATGAGRDSPVVRFRSIISSTASR